MERPKVVVTFVCASSDQVRIEPVVEALRASGREAELVAGVDEQPRRVGEAIDRCGEWGLIAVCTSRHLDGPDLRKVEGVFSARRGPNYAMIRVDASQPEREIVAAIERAAEAFASHQGRIVRRSKSDGPQLREVLPVGDMSTLAMPVVRLAPGEELDGDTTRIQLPDNPKSAELARRRRAARQREKERERIAERTASHAVIEDQAAESSLNSRSSVLRADEQKLDRMMVVMIIGAGLLAIVVALSLAGIL